MVPSLGWLRMIGWTRECAPHGWIVGLCAASLGVGGWGCGGASPLLHPAHAMQADEVTVGAGVAATIPVTEETLATALRTVHLDELATNSGAPNVDSACFGTTIGDSVVAYALP